jgi:hypothetical protein
MKVVNLKKEKYEVYVGRGSMWGNSFKIGVDGNRENVIEKYKKELWTKMQDPEFCKIMLRELDGKVLGCYCKPSQCHGDVLISAIEWLKKNETYLSGNKILMEVRP